MLIKLKENCLSINGKQSVQLEEGTIGFQNYIKQMPVSFKIYADFECTLKRAENYEGFYTKKYQCHIPCSYACKVVCIDNRFSKLIVVYRDKNAAFEFIRAILKESKYCKKIRKKHFNENLIMSEEEEQLFQKSNSCHICKKLINNDDKKVRDHCHVTGKFRGAVHRSCNVNFQLTKKVPVIFHNLRGYDSHLILCKLDKFDIKINVIPNGFEKYMAFF